MLRSLACSLLLLSSWVGLPLNAHAQQALPPARVRLTLQQPERVIVGTLLGTTPDSVFLLVRGSGRPDSLALPHTVIQRAEVSVGRRAATAGGVLVGGLLGLTYVLGGHQGLPHLGGDAWSVIIMELVLYSVPFAALGGLLVEAVAQERWMPTSLSLGPETNASRLRVVFRWPTSRG